MQKIQQAKDQYEQVLGQVQPKLEAAPNPSPFKKLESMQADLASGKQAMESSAQGEEFEQALQQANDLGTKVEAYLAAVQDLEAKKQQYEDALEKLKANLEGMPKTDYPKLPTMKQDIDTVKGQMESAAQIGDYEQALAMPNDLTTKVDAYATAVRGLEKKKKAYESGFEAIKPKLAEALQSKNPDAGPVQKELLISKQQMEEAAKNGDYEL